MFTFDFDGFDAKKTLGKLRKQKHLSEVERLGKLAAFVGWPETAIAESKDGERVSIAGYAKKNNYGYTTRLGKKQVNVPARPFFTKGFFAEKYNETRAKLAKFVVKSVMGGKKSAAEGLGLIGQKAVEQVQDSIQTGKWAPNAPYTIAKKGSSKPLIDTGAMITRVTYIVKGEGQE